MAENTNTNLEHIEYGDTVEQVFAKNNDAFDKINENGQGVKNLDEAVLAARTNGVTGATHETLKARLDADSQLIKELDDKHDNDVSLERNVTQNIENINNRVNNLLVQNQPTEGNSELIDIRTGADGKVYSTAGEAVRSIGKFQVNSNILRNFTDYTEGMAINGKGEVVPVYTWITSNFIPCFGSLYCVGKAQSTTNNYKNVAFYDINKKFISGVRFSDSRDDSHVVSSLDVIITPPSKAAYVRICNSIGLWNGIEIYFKESISALPGILQGLQEANNSTKQLVSYLDCFSWINGEYLDVSLGAESSTVMKISAKVRSDYGQDCYIVNHLDGIPVSQVDVPRNTQFNAITEESVNKFWLLYVQRTTNELGEIGYILLAKVTSIANLNKTKKFIDNNTALIGLFYGGRLVQCNPYARLRVNQEYTSPQVLSRTQFKVLTLSYGAISIDTVNNTIQVTEKILAWRDNGYLWIEKNEEPLPISQKFVAVDDPVPTKVIVFDFSTGELDIVSTGLPVHRFKNYACLAIIYGIDNIITISGNHNLGAFKFNINGITKPMGDWLYNEKTSGTYANNFVEPRYKNYIAEQIQNVSTTFNPEKDGMSDIIVPKTIDCMEGRMLSIYFDTLSRFENAENLYRITNSKNLQRNEYCMNYTPVAGDSTFGVSFIRLHRYLATTQESKSVSIKVNHKISGNPTKNICICGDSLVDNGSVATEVFRLLGEDADCVVNQIGTRGPSGGKHEGRGSWRWADYLKGDEWSGKTNAFWDSESSQVNFQKYCEKNGFSGIDYFLIALGTNDVTQGSTTYNTLESVQKFIDQAKQFIDILLSEDRGYPNCKIGVGLIGIGADYFYNANANSYIFRKSANTLNLAYLEAFDDGKYHPNVTCFSHGVMTNRKYAFPHSDKAISDRYSETSRTLTNNVHPTAQGYQAWADGYYNKIRGWLTDDSE